MPTKFNKTTGKYENTGGLTDEEIEKELGDGGTGHSTGSTTAANINAQTARTTASAKSKAAALKVKNDKASVDAKNLYTQQQNALAVEQQQKTNQNDYYKKRFQL